MFSPSFCLELRSFLISSLQCEIFVVKSELDLSRTLLYHCSMPMHFYRKTVQNALAILVQVKFHDGKVDTFRKELLVV